MWQLSKWFYCNYFWGKSEKKHMTGIRTNQVNFSNTSFQKLRRVVRFYFRLQLYSAQIKCLFDFILWNFNKLIFFHTARENTPSLSRIQIKPHSSSKKRNSLIRFCRNISFTRKEDYFIICLRISWRVKKFRAQRLLVFEKFIFSYVC